MNNTNKINLYRCANGHATIAVDRDEGTTPFLIRCQHEGCNKAARSSGYKCNQEFKPTHEFVKLSATKNMSNDTKRHIKQGGLILRKIKAEQQENKNIRVHRNDPCPCGSGVKFKNCHLNKVTK